MKKTYKLYYDDPYMTDFTAQILHIDEENEQFHVALTQSCFYPSGGGQPCDTGTINGIFVHDCYEKDGRIYHVLAEKPEGDFVEGRVDFARRYALLQNHTGEHILSGLAKSHFGANNVGFHMSEQGFTMDLDKPLDREDLGRLESLANQAVQQGLRVEISSILGKDVANVDFRSKRDFADDEEIRLVSVPGYDLCACAALHVQNSLAVGIIKIVAQQKYKKGIRLTVFCGIDAYKDYSQKNDICKELGAILSADTVSIISALNGLVQRKADLQKHSAALQGKIFELKAEKVPINADLAYFFETELDAQDMRRFTKLVAERAKIAVALSKQDDIYKYAICSQNENELNDFTNRFVLALQGKGGVSGCMANGVLKAGHEDILAFLEKEYGKN